MVPTGHFVPAVLLTQFSLSTANALTVCHLTLMSHHQYFTAHPIFRSCRVRRRVWAPDVRANRNFLIDQLNQLRSVNRVFQSGN